MGNQHLGPKRAATWAQGHRYRGSGLRRLQRLASLAFAGEYFSLGCGGMHKSFIRGITEGTTMETITEKDPLLALLGSGDGLWADEHADEYVNRLREGWE